MMEKQVQLASLVKTAIERCKNKKNKKLVKENDFTKVFDELIDTLQKAKDLAEEAGLQAKNNEDLAGTEGNDVAGYLIDIWNGFSTGDSRNKEHEDEWFK